MQARKWWRSALGWPVASLIGAGAVLDGCKDDTKVDEPIQVVSVSARVASPTGPSGSEGTPSLVAFPDASAATEGPYATSYAVAKRIDVPQIVKPGPYFTAYAIADFRKIGRLDLVTFSYNYDPSRQSYDTIRTALASGDNSYLADARAWKPTEGGTYSATNFTIKTCLHPRKAVVADFDSDGYPDIFVACHGYDGPPYPGESSIILFNNQRGGFNVKVAEKRPGFYHSAAAADVNKDGLTDVVAVDPNRIPSVYVLMNQGNKSFRADDTRISGLQDQTGSYYSVELTDVDGDGVNDLLVGGHEFNVPTKILYGDRRGRFGAGGRERVIPAVPGRGVVLDFVVQRLNARSGVYVNRTSDPTSAAGFYNAQTLQWYNLKTGASEVLLDKAGNANWIAWWRPVKQRKVLGVEPFATTDNVGQPVGDLFRSR